MSETCLIYEYEFISLKANKNFTMCSSNSMNKLSYLMSGKQMKIKLELLKNEWQLEINVLFNLF